MKSTIDSPPKGRPADARSPFWMGMSLAGGLLAVLALIYILLVEAPPPKKLVISTGGKDGQYYKNALRYAELLQKDGVVLEVRESQGSIENLDRLLDPNSGVDIALVQSGTADPTRCESLNSLASLYREPLWIFQKNGPAITRLSQMAGMKIAMGKEGSGTRAIAEQLLAANGITAKKADYRPETGSAAADLLIAGTVDAAFFVVGSEAVYVQKLLKASEVKIVELAQLDAYARRFRFLSTVTVPAGLIDFGENVPAKETKLLSPAATLVARKTLHPALVPLLLTAVSRVHDSGDLLGNPGEFPSSLYTDLPVDEDAARFLKSGPPFLQKVFPFWLASFIERIKYMVIPVIMLVMPAVRAAPPLMRWRIRRKIYTWYSQLREIDKKMFEGMSPDDARKSLERLNILDEQVAYVEIPLSYMEEYYNLRVHLHLVNLRVKAIVAGE